MKLVLYAFLPMHLSKSYPRQIDAIYAELAPPPQTALLPLPAHLVPAPLRAEDVATWLGRGAGGGKKRRNS